MPSSLQAKISEQQCVHTVSRNQHLLGECTDTFLGRFMVLLTETSLMPGECVLKQGEIARELSFVSKGAVRVTDDRGTLVELLTGDGTSPCVIGSTSFLMGKPIFPSWPVWYINVLHACAPRHVASLCLWKPPVLACGASVFSKAVRMFACADSNCLEPFKFRCSACTPSCGWHLHVVGTKALSQPWST